MEPDRKLIMNLLYFVLLLGACMVASIIASWLAGGPWFGG